MSEQTIPIGQMPTGVPDTVEAIASWEAYLETCLTTLTADDHYHIAGNLGRHRSGWVKLRRQQGISIQILYRDEWKDADAGDWGWDFEVRAILPGGRYEDADGSASYVELMANWVKWGKKGPEPNRHIVRARALTRAKNRATQDLLGLPETTPVGRPAHALAAKRLNALTKLQRDANITLDARGHKAYYYYRDPKHVARALETLAVSSYNKDRHDEIVEQLVDHATSLAAVNGQTAAESAVDLFG